MSIAKLHLNCVIAFVFSFQSKSVVISRMRCVYHKISIKCIFEGKICYFRRDMKTISVFWMVLLFFGHGYSQSLKELAEWQIPYPAAYLEIDNSGNIYLSHTQTHQISRINTEVKPCTTQTIGGRGFEQERFNKPKRIIAKNRQAVLVMDYGNQRIAVFNERLRYMEEINFNKNEYPVQNPTDIAQNISGDIYLIDENIPGVTKLSRKGEIIATFGGYDWGKGSLSEPVQIIVSNANFVYVWDKQKKCIQKYDVFGVYLHTIPVSYNKLTRFYVSEPYIFYLTSNKEVYCYSQIDKKESKMEIKEGLNSVLDIHITEPVDILERLKNKDYEQTVRRMYILTDTKVVVYEITL